MSKPRDERQKDLLRPPLDEIIDLGHPLARLAREIDWGFLDGRFSSVCRAGAGQPPLPTRLVAGLLILKDLHDLSDEALCARNPYYQFFCGEESFQHVLPFDRSSLTRWRQRLGEEQLTALLQESLSVAHKTGALATKDLERVAVDTTVQPKNVAFPTDARLMHKAIVMLGREARKHGVPLRQSYVRVAKRAALMAGRYAHAKQFKRHNRELRFLRTRLGRLIRDIRRKIDGDETLKELFAIPLSRADQVRHQRQRQRGWKLYSLHAPEVECIGKGKAHRPYEFGVKVSIATTNARAHGGQFVLHAKALPGNPYDGHTLAEVITETQALTGGEIKRVYVDKGYRGHDAPNPFRVYRSGQKRGVHGVIRKELRRRAAIEAVIGHLKTDGHLGRNYLKGRHGDHANAVLTAVGHNLRLVLKWLRALLAQIIAALSATLMPRSALKAAS